MKIIHPLGGAALVWVAMSSVTIGLAIYRIDTAGSELSLAITSIEWSAKARPASSREFDDAARVVPGGADTGEPQWQRRDLESPGGRSGMWLGPSGFENIQWAVGPAPVRATDAGRPDHGSPASLVDLMKAAGFSDADIRRLRQAASNPNPHAAARRADSADAAQPPAAVRSQSLRLMRATEHRFQARVMMPADDFLAHLDDPKGAHR